jgi:hypothetical protein
MMLVQDGFFVPVNLGISRGNYDFRFHADVLIAGWKEASHHW